MGTEHDEANELRHVLALPIAEYSRVLNDESDPLHAVAKQYSKDTSERLSQAYMQALGRTHPEVVSKIQRATESALEPMRARMLVAARDGRPGGDTRTAAAERVIPARPTEPAQHASGTVEELVALRLAQEEATSRVLGELADQRDEAAKRADASEERAVTADRKARNATRLAWASLAVTVIIGAVGIYLTI